jgi:serpin B
MTRAILASFVLAACTDPRDIMPPGEEVRSKAQRITQEASDQDLAEATAANTALGLKLLAQKPEGNFMVSSYSISAATSMLAAGATGDTLGGIEHALQQTLPAARHHRAMNTLEAQLEARGKTAKGKDGKPFRLVVSNQLFAPRGQHFESGYLDTLAQEYGAGVRLLDFSKDTARTSINQWVSQRTEGKITELFAPNSLLDARLAVVNTLYFNAAWEDAFPASKTTQQPFTLLDGQKVSVAMMRNNELQQGKSAIVDDVQVLELPYDGGEVSLVVMAPQVGEFAGFTQSLDASKVARLTQALESKTLDVSLPKFNIRSDLDLKPALEALGMKDAFDPSKADFSGMTGDQSIFIGVAVHKTVIILDESGTEAAAATGFGGFTTSVPATPVKVVIDRPFVFFIRDLKTGATLFTGRVVNPN